MNDFIVSARKYRPSNFNDVVGQSAITTTLSNAIKGNHLAQSFLFCGPRGVGKTTCARILAKTINCETITKEFIACNSCESCKSFNNHNSFNIHELDAASNNSVDDIRNLIEKVRLAPQVGRYSIYIIDEVHMLSSAAFNAFLKTLEEPPSHAVFILATTEKNKIIPTILSRCQIFDFKSILISDIITYLEYVSTSEKIKSEQDALSIIAQKSGGSLRDALSMFDRLVNSTNLTLTYRSVIENLNILDHDYYFKMTSDLITHDISSILLTFNEILENGFDAHEFIMGLSGHFRDLLVCKDVNTVVLLNKGEELQKKYVDQSKDCELDFLIKALRICNKCDVEYKISKDQRLLIELTLLKLASIGDIFAKKKDLQKIMPFNKKSIQVESSTEVKEVKIPIAEKLIGNKKESLDKKKIRKPSFSITEILKDDKNDKQKDGKDSENRLSDFDEQKMLDVWMKFADNAKKNGKTNLYITLTSFSPKLIDNYLIQLEVSNNAQKQILNEHRLDLLQYLRDILNNDMIKIETEIIDIIDNNVYTEKDKLNKIIEENPSLKILKDKLGLDPEY